jgi:hypothetical protein
MYVFIVLRQSSLNEDGMRGADISSWQDRELSPLQVRKSRRAFFRAPKLPGILLRMSAVTVLWACLFVVSLMHLETSFHDVPLYEPQAMADIEQMLQQVTEPAPVLFKQHERLTQIDSVATASTGEPEIEQEKTFSRIQVLDGATFEADGQRVRIEGVSVPALGAVCSTLDNRREPCMIRAATRLELLTRWRSLTCRLRPDGISPHWTGSCRIGQHDIAERLRFQDPIFPESVSEWAMAKSQDRL